MRAKLEQARAVRSSGHGQAALPMLADALALETRWKLAVPADVVALRDSEIAAATEAVAAVVRPQLAARTPLAAGKRIEKLLSLFVHPRLAAVRDKTMADIVAAGKARCAELTASDGARTPYLARLAAGYCRPYCVEIAAPATPEQRRGLRVSGRVESTSDAQHRAIESWVALGVSGIRLVRSPTPRPPRRWPSPVTYDAKLERKQVTLTAPYRSVETTTVKRAYLNTGIKLETESERIFPYLAEQYDARYHLDATLTLQLADGAPPFVIRVNWEEKRKAYEHDVSFPRGRPPAEGQSPERERLAVQASRGKQHRARQEAAVALGQAFCAPALRSRRRRARVCGAGERIRAPWPRLKRCSARTHRCCSNAARGAGRRTSSRETPDITPKPASPTDGAGRPGSGRGSTSPGVA